MNQPISRATTKIITTSTTALKTTTQLITTTIVKTTTTTTTTEDNSVGFRFCKQQCENRLKQTNKWSSLTCSCKYSIVSKRCFCSCVFQLGIVYELEPYEYPLVCIGLFKD